MSAMEPPAAPAYLARVGDAAGDRATVLSIWQGVLGEEKRRHAAKYDWFYLGCPWGEPLLELLQHTQTATCVATAAAGSRRMLWRGRAIRAGVLADMAVSTRHRTLGPALTLQSGLMAAASGRFDLLYGFPNPKATAVAQRAGYPVIGQLRRYTCVLRHGGYFARLMPRILAQVLGWMFDAFRDGQRAVHASAHPRMTATWHDAADSRMDELWQSSPHGNGLIAVRDAAMLRWRFDQLPEIRTRYLYLSESGTDSLQAWFACQTDGTSLHVRDFWSRDAAQGIRRTLVDALGRAVRRTGERYTSLSVEYAAPAS
ncbi:MAG TPA: hypothetical protein VIM06_05290, partial [Rhodanobacter sp.]